MRFLVHAGITLALLVLLGAIAGFFVTRNGLSALDEPPALEAAVARRLRSLAIPSGAASRVNPYSDDQQAWIEGGRHFQDHCAVCHAEDGSGRSEIGRNLYPRAPDMRAASTQGLSDGEVYFIIMHGIRYTGMPGWQGEHTPDEAWKLVSFIRRLPRLVPEDLERLETTGEGGSSHRDAP